MSNQINEPNKNATSSAVKLGAIIVATSMLIGASFGVQAVADSKMYQHAKLYLSSPEASESNPFVHEAGWGKRRGRADWANLTDAEIEKKVSRAVKHVAIEIDATDEQTARITTLVTAVAKNMKPLRGEFRSAGEELQKLLVSNTIDRTALEAVRAERLAEADRVSKELMTALADVAEILTPEQRKILDERLDQFKSMRGRWHRG